MKTAAASYSSSPAQGQSTAAHVNRLLPINLCIGSRCAGMHMGMQEYWDTI